MTPTKQRPNTLFENDRFLAPERISATAFLPDGRLVAVTRSKVCVFDGETGRSVAAIDAPRAFHVVDVVVDPSGKQILVHDTTNRPVLFDIGHDSITVASHLSIDFNPPIDSENSSAAIGPERIVIATSKGADVFDVVTGKRVKRIANPLEDESSRVSVSPKTGRFVVWRDGTRAACWDIEKHRKVTLESVASDDNDDNSGEEIVRFIGDFEFSIDESILAVPIQNDQTDELEIHLIDPASGSVRKKLITTALNGGVTLTISPDNRTLLVHLLNEGVLRAWSLSTDEILWTSEGCWEPFGTNVFHPANSGRAAITRDNRIFVIDAATGARIGEEHLPSGAIIDVVRDRHGRIVAKDPYRAYVIEPQASTASRVIHETNASSIHLDVDGTALVLSDDGVILRVAEDGAYEPIAQLPRFNSEEPTRVDPRGAHILVARPGDKSPLQLFDRSRRASREIGQHNVSEALFATDDIIAIARVTHDELYNLVQSIAVWVMQDNRIGVRWSKAIDGDESIELLDANAHAIVVRKGAAVAIYAVTNGELIAEIAFDSRPTGAACAGEKVFVLAKDGSLHCVMTNPAGDSSHERVRRIPMDVASGATAFHIDASRARGIVAFNARSIIEIDLSSEIASVPFASAPTLPTSIEDEAETDNSEGEGEGEGEGDGEDAEPVDVDDILPLRTAQKHSFEDLTELHWNVVKDLGAGSAISSSEALHEVAVIHACRGETELAARHARRVPTVRNRVMALADCASWLAKLHSSDVNLAIAHEWLAEAEGLLAGSLSDDSFANADVAAAHRLLGNDEEANKRFAIANKGAIGVSETHDFQNHAHLAAAYLRTNDVKRATESIDRGPWEGDIVPPYLAKYIAHAADSAHVDHAFELASRCRETMGVVDWTTLESLTTAMMRASRHGEQLAWLEDETTKLTSHEEKRIIDDLIAKGRPDVVVAHYSKINDDDGPYYIAQKTRILARVAPHLVPSLLERVLQAMPQEPSRNSVGSIVEDLAEALASIGQGSATQAIEKGLDDSELFHLRCGLARGGDVSSVQRALEYARAQTPPRRRITALAELGRALGSAAIFDEAREIARELRGDDGRFALSNLLSAEIEAGELRGAYRTWLTLPSPSDREYELAQLIEAIGNAHAIDAAMYVLGKLGRHKDSVAKEALRAIRHASGIKSAIV